MEQSQIVGQGVRAGMCGEEEVEGEIWDAAKETMRSSEPLALVHRKALRKPKLMWQWEDERC